MRIVTLWTNGGVILNSLLVTVGFISVLFIKHCSDRSHLWFVETDHGSKIPKS